MRKAALDRILGLSVLGVCLGCGASPAYDARTPTTVTVPANDVMVVPAERVVHKCPCDAAPDAPARTGTVEYVHLTQWRSPASATRAEAFVAENPSRFRSPHPPPASLTMHQGIPEIGFSRMGRTRFGRY